MSAPSSPAKTAVRRVLLIDDHPITRAGMRALIEAHPAFAVCGEADNTASAKASVEQSRPDIAIVDISLRGENGLELVAELNAANAGLPLVVVSMHDEEFYAPRAHRAGARGYVMKEHASDQIVSALLAVAAGRTAFGKFVPPNAAPDLRFKRSVRGGLDALSEREVEVLGLIGDGYATREIAEKLGLSAKTIDTYRENLKLKLGLADGEKLIRFAVQWSASNRGPGGAGRPATN